MVMTDPFAGIRFAGEEEREDAPSWGKRPDGSEKGPGHLGTLKSNSGKDMTEYSIGVNLDGKETDIPTLVPTLSPEEIEFLKTEPEAKDIPKEIIDKAVAYARQRSTQGQSAFVEKKQSSPDPFDGIGFGEDTESPFAGLGFDGQEVELNEIQIPRPVGSNVEQSQLDFSTEEQPNTLRSIPSLMGRDLLDAGKDLGTEYLDTQKERFKTLFSLGGPAKLGAADLETFINFGAGALSWLPSKIGLVAQTGIGKALQAEDALRDGKKYNLSDYDVAYSAEKVEQTIGNLLPSIIGEPKTEIGKRQTKFLGDIFDTALTPLKTAATFYKEAGWPNFGNMLALTGELLAFKALHKGSSAIKDKVFKEKIQAAETPSDMTEMVKAFKEEAIIQAEQNAKMLDVISPERAALAENARMIKLEEIKKESKEAKKQAKKSLENFKQHQELIKEAKKNKMSLNDLIKDRLEKNQKILDSVEQMSDFALKEIKQKEVELSKSELSQRGRGFDGSNVSRPNLGPEAVSGLKIETSPVTSMPKARVEFLSDEGIPRATYQIENGKIKEIEKIGERSVNQIDPVTGKVQLVEKIPGQKSVYQILTNPLTNESGAVTIPKSRKDLLNKTTPTFRENVRKFETLAKESGKDFETFLKENGFNKKELQQMINLAEVVKLDRPFESTKSFDPISTGKDPLKPQPGEVNINTGRNANPKTFIGSDFFEGIKNIKDITLPPIVQALTPTIHMIKGMKSPQMLDLWHKVKNIEGNRIKDINILKDTALALRDQYPKRKLREEAFIKIMSQDNLGRRALEMLDIKPIDGPIKYEGLVLELQTQFKDLFNQLNTMRESIGKRKIAERQSYLPMIAQENFYSQMRKLFKGEKGEINNPNLVLDSVESINHRHSPSAVEATRLRHLKRRGLKQGVKLEMDPLKLFSQYGSTAYKHIHYSPFNMFINQLTGNKFKVTNAEGKVFDWKMETQKPELKEFLARWSNSLAGKPNVVHGPSLRFLETGVQKLSQNLTAAVLGWSVRTVLVQPTALLPTMTEFGVTPTVRGLIRTATRSKKDAIKYSQELPNRTSDAFINDIVSNHLKSPAGRIASLPAEKALSAMRFVDYVSAEATWRTAFESSKHLGERTAARLADEAVVRTQGSGFVGDLSPIQMNALGKAVTLWQTFTINNMNWLAREVLNIKHPERNPTETARRVATYVIGTAIINNIFEEQMGIQSPQPAPIREMIKAAQKGDSNFAVAYQGLKEMTELTPFLSSLKFGSSPAGAVAEFLKALSQAASEDLPKALNGDKNAMKRVGFVAAKLWGVPGTQQIKRISQGTPLGYPVEKLADTTTGKRQTTRKRTTRTRTSRKRISRKRRSR